MKDTGTLRAVQHGHGAGLFHAQTLLRARWPDAADYLAREYKAYCRAYDLPDHFTEGEEDHAAPQSLGSH